MLNTSGVSSSSCKDTSPIALGLSTLTTSFNLNHLFAGPISNTVTLEEGLQQVGLKSRTQSTAVPLFLLTQLTPTLSPNNPDSSCSLPSLKGFPHFATNRTVTDMAWGLTDLLFSLSLQSLFPGEWGYFCSHHIRTGLTTGFDQWKVAGRTLLLQAGIYRALELLCIFPGTFPQSTLASQTARTSSLPGYQQDEKPCGEKDPGEERVVETEVQFPAPSQTFKWDHQGE